jgi:methylated-DNA-[protein]-cysteine S-methyltransferase
MEERKTLPLGDLGRNAGNTFPEVVVMLSWHRRSPREEVLSSVLNSPCGRWLVEWSSGGLCSIKSPGDPVQDRPGQDILPIWLEKAWELFWEGETFHVTFCLERPIHDFTRRVYEVTAGIPFGETMTYGQVAEISGNPRAARGVGSIMRSNPWALFIPCHRVIGADGDLRGYGGVWGIPLKKRLIAYEKKISMDNRELLIRDSEKR